MVFYHTKVKLRGRIVLEYQLVLSRLLFTLGDLEAGLCVSSWSGWVESILHGNGGLTNVRGWI